MKLLRVTTVPISLRILLRGQLPFMRKNGIECFMASAYDGNVPKLVEEQESPHFVVPMTRRISPLTDAYCIFVFYKLCKKLKPDVVHSHTPKAGLVAMVGAKLAGVPLRIHTVAGMPLTVETGVKKALLMTVERLIYSCANSVLSNSARLMEFIIKANLCSRDKIKVLGNGSSNGISTSHFSLNEEMIDAGRKVRNRLSVKPYDFVYIFVGRLVRDKGIVELIDAFVSIQKRYESVKLILVGEFEPSLDPLPPSTLSLIESTSSIICVGFQEDIRPFLAGSNVFVFPSYREGFPNSPMQAGSMELPLIVSDINGCNEIVVNGENGYVVAPGNTGALKTAMENIFLNKNEYIRIRNNSRSFIHGKFDQITIWSLILNEYKKHN